MFELIRISRALLAHAVKSGTWSKVGPLLAELGRALTVHAAAIHHSDASPDPAAVRRLMASATPTIEADLDAAGVECQRAAAQFGWEPGSNAPRATFGAPGAGDPARIDPATVLVIVQLVTQILDAIRRRRQAATGMTSTAPPELGDGSEGTRPELGAGAPGGPEGPADRPELNDDAATRAARQTRAAGEANGGAAAGT